MKSQQPLSASVGAALGHGPSDLGMVLAGGGARAAYQVGFLRHLAQHAPDLQIPYIHGVSAGAINAAVLASHHGTFLQAVEELSSLWRELTVDEVFRVDSRSLLMNGLRWLGKLGGGGVRDDRPKVRSLVDTTPLDAYLSESFHVVNRELTGVQYNLEYRGLKAFAVTTTSYSTGSSVTWLQGREVETWERPQRETRQANITVDHIMASAALPLLFPAIQLEGDWYGDGGIRLTAPLSPVLHLGARRIIAISNRYDRNNEEVANTSIRGYPPPAQVAGIILNSVFLDLLEHDALGIERLNRLLEVLPESQHDGLKPAKLLLLRPSVDLGRLASQFEVQLPWPIRFLTRGLGTKETDSPDMLSLILFRADYVSALMEIGEADAAARHEEIMEFLEG